MRNIISSQGQILGRSGSGFIYQILISFQAFQAYCKDFRGKVDLQERIFFLFLLGRDLQIMFLPEGVPPPVGLEPAEVEVPGLGVLGAAELQLPDQVDDGSVAELVLVLLAVGDHLLLVLRLQVHLGQDGHPVLVSLPQQVVEQNLNRTHSLKKVILPKHLNNKRHLIT